jgi:hypothetical protein
MTKTMSSSTDTAAVDTKPDYQQQRLTRTKAGVDAVVRQLISEGLLN